MELSGEEKKFDDFFRLDTIHECNRRTLTDSLRIASRVN